MSDIQLYNSSEIRILGIIIQLLIFQIMVLLLGNTFISFIYTFDRPFMPYLKIFRF